MLWQADDGREIVIMCLEKQQRYSIASRTMVTFVVEKHYYLMTGLEWFEACDEHFPKAAPRMWNLYAPCSTTQVA